MGCYGRVPDEVDGRRAYWPRDQTRFAFWSDTCFSLPSLNAKVGVETRSGWYVGTLKVSVIYVFMRR